MEKLNFLSHLRRVSVKKPLGFFNHLYLVNFINVKYAPENILHSLLLFWFPMTVLVIDKLQSSCWMKVQNLVFRAVSYL